MGSTSGLRKGGLGVAKLRGGFSRVMVLLISFVWLVTACSGGSSGAEAELANVSQGGNASDAMFAQMMIPHHEQAVVMADIAEGRAVAPQIRDLATEIKAAQDSEIVLMQGWLEQWGMPVLSGDDALVMHGGHGMQGMLSDSQLDALRQAEGDTFDVMFAQYMVEHHLGAMAMARDVLDQGENPNVAQLAREIIVVQEKEILQLNAFLSGEQTSALIQIAPALGHVHGVVTRDEEVLVGTHDGVHRVSVRSGRSERIGESRDDLMALAGDPSTVLVGSGHPGPGSSMPNPLGLITSTDGGKTWESQSLSGQVDFHTLAARGDDIVGWDTRGPLQWSTDGGVTWQRGPEVVATSLAWFQDQVWVASPETGLSLWTPGADGLEQQGHPSVLLASSPLSQVLWRLDSNGSVHATVDGTQWSQKGSVSQVEALTASQEEALVVTASSIRIVPFD